MAFSLGHGKKLDTAPGIIGFGPDELPPIDAGIIDFNTWFPPPTLPPTLPPQDSTFDSLTSTECGHPPLELEIGSGKGTFLVQQSQLQPDTNFIGIEYAREFYRFAADRVRRHNLPNVRMVNLDAGAFLRSYVADDSLFRVHLYFPDPWPKKRHHKRRFVQTDNLHLVHRKLIDSPDSEMRIATDHADYFAWMQDIFATVPELFEVVPFERPASAGDGELVGTNFERKYRREGRPFHAVTLRYRPQ